MALLEAVQKGWMPPEVITKESGTMKTCPKCNKDYENKQVCRRYIFDHEILCDDCYNEALIKLPSNQKKRI
jgi:hypothetical protein